MEILLLYFRTIKYLRLIQILGRLKRYLNFNRPVIKVRPELRKFTDRLNLVPTLQKKNTCIGPTEFIFLNQYGDIKEVGWDGPQREKLWRYNQHYFDYLNSNKNNKREKWHLALIHDWISKNAPVRSVGWEPYPTSLRIINWIKWGLDRKKIPEIFLESLATQTRWLEKNIEFHLLGNHLIANAKALIFSGLYFDGKEADRWLSLGLKILKVQISEQILADGGHIERSPMYHAIILEDVLDLINIMTSYSNNSSKNLTDDIKKLRTTASSMIKWLWTMSHPDGELSFFNDCSFGVAPVFSDLKAYATALKIYEESYESISTFFLPDSGYVRIQNEDAVLLIDVAEIGPDYIPGHAHADTLAFELSLFCHRIIVNSGTSCYEKSTERSRQRGTAAHNTVVVDNINSSEVWASFRVGRRARPVSRTVVLNANTSNVECSHDGYSHLLGNPIHKRRWIFNNKNLIIEDYIISSHRHKSIGYLHLHPSVEILLGKNLSEAILTLPDRHTLRIKNEQGDFTVQASTWHPEFGRSILNQVLSYEIINSSSRILISW